MFLYEKWERTAEQFIPQIICRERLAHSRILITGATGLIGSAILDLLIYLNERYNYGMELYAAVRNTKRAEERFSKFVEKNYFHIVSYEANQLVTFDFEVDMIIQAASDADPCAISTRPVETLMSNVYGLYQMLEYGNRKKIQRMLFISSSEIYGTNTMGKPFKENDYGSVDLLNPRASYPMGKRAAETLCVSYAKEYNIDVTIVRPGHIYGPTISEKDSRASAQFARKALKGENIILKSDGKQLRSYCYVYDCATAVLTVLLTGCSGTAYNISNKNSVQSIRDLADVFAKIGGSRLVFDIPSAEEKASYNLMDMSALDASRLEALGWKAIVGTEEGVRMTLEFMK